MKNCEWLSWLIVKLEFKRLIDVVYFDQCLGAAHYQRWSKYTYLTFCEPKSWKKEEKARNLRLNLAKNVFFKFAPECGSSVLFPEKNKFTVVKYMFTKDVNKHILTSVWNVQHPNAGWNIQQIEEMKKSQVDIVGNISADLKHAILMFDGLLVKTVMIWITG